MSKVGASLALGILFGWCVVQVLVLVFSPAYAVALGLTVGLATSLGLQRTVPVGALVAVLAPFGLMLPALALASLGRLVGLELPSFSAWELAGFLVLYTGFLLTAFGLVPVDVYRLGYAAKPVAVMVLGLCFYGALTENWFIALVALLAQLCWHFKLGSSNWFDFVLHVLMWPIAAVALIAKLF
jgi:hypothetical protein